MAASGETLLLIDDDLAIQEVLADRLEALGYRVVVAANGHAGKMVINVQASAAAEKGNGRDASRYELDAGSHATAG